MIVIPRSAEVVKAGTCKLSCEQHVLNPVRPLQPRAPAAEFILLLVAEALGTLRREEWSVYAIEAE